MQRHVVVVTSACLLTLQMQTSLAGGAFCEGIVVEVTQDTIKIEQGGKPYTLLMSNELQTNTETEPPMLSSIKLKDVKMGDKVAVEYHKEDGVLVFTHIRPCPPTDAGIVTVLAEDSITIRNDKGTTAFYRVKKNLVDDSIQKYSSLYPSRFSDVTVGCRLEIIAYKQDDQMVIWALDVKKQK